MTAEVVNSLAPGRFQRHFRKVIFQLILVIDGWSISCKIALKWMPMDLTDGKSTLVQAMAWCHQASSHYLNQCWPRSPTPYGITRPQWVNISMYHKANNNSIIYNTFFTHSTFYVIFFFFFWSGQASGQSNYQAIACNNLTKLTMMIQVTACKYHPDQTIKNPTPLLPNPQQWLQFEVPVQSWCFNLG